MNTISNSSTFSVGAYTNKGMSGLVSGLDTEGMVEQMLSGTQGKIDKQTGLKQQLTWKQEIYRELIGEINTFSDRFFGLESSTNLKSTNYFDNMLATAQSTAFRVMGTSSASTGVSSMIVKQLATSAKAQSAGAASSRELSGKLDLSALGRTVVFEVGNDPNAASTEITVDLSGAASVDDVLAKLNAALGTNAQAQIDADTKKLEIKGDSVWVSAKSDSLGLQMLGLSANRASIKGATDDLGYTLTGGAPSLNPEVSMTVALDGKQTTVKFDLELAAKAGGSPAEKAAFVDSVNEQLLHAFGTTNLGDPLAALKIAGDGSVALQSGGEGHQLAVGGAGAALELLGFKSGQSDKISTSVALRDLRFAGGALSGERFSFQINDQEFSFSRDATVYQVMKAVNNSGAGVRMVYSALDDTFSLESTSTGAGQELRIEQTEGNLLTAMFGVEAAQKAVGGVLTNGGTLAGGTLASAVESGTFSLAVDGRTYSFSLSRKTDSAGAVEPYTDIDLMRQLNRAFERQFGFAADGTANVVLKKNGADFSLEAKNGMAVSFGPATGKDSDLAERMGFAGKTNIPTEADAPAVICAQMGITAKTKDELEAAGIWLDYDAEGKFTGRVALTKDALTSFSADNLKNLGFSDAALGDGKSGLNVVRQGQNAIAVIDGVETERSSNAFTANGLSFELLAVSAHQTNDVTWVPGSANTLKSMEIGSELKDAAGNRIGFLAAGLQKDAAGNIAARDVTDATGRIIGSLTVDVDGKGWVNLKATATEPARSVGLGSYSATSNFTADTITTERDTDTIFEGLKSFVEEYNKLIKKLNDYVDKDPTYKKYPPLTSAQKKEMTDREIELWEEKAKEGLLHNDSDISSFLSAMRIVLYQKPAGARYALFDIGIETGSYAKKGQLVLDEKKLKEMLKSDPEAIRQLFADTSEGLAQKLSDAVDAAAKLSYGSKGTLVALAGMEGYASDKDNTLYWQMREIDERVRDLNTKYEKERKRYWNQFNAMEQALAQMQNQSSWIGQQFSMNG